jgi:hypothetical protein
MENPVMGLPWRNLGLRVLEVMPIKFIELHHSFHNIF